MSRYKSALVLTPNERDFIHVLLESYKRIGKAAGVQLGPLDEALFDKVFGRLAQPDNPNYGAIVDLAQQDARDEELEIDDPTVVSEEDDNGAYVLCWHWVTFSGTPLDKQYQDCCELKDECTCNKEESINA